MRYVKNDRDLREEKKGKKIKIAMIGPAYPFRGGISHYSIQLYRALKRTHEVVFFSFKRQYPNWLFPGKSDRETDNKKTKDPDIIYLFDSLNPITWFDVYRRIKTEKPHIKRRQNLKR